MNYAHLSQEERYQIRWLRKGGWSLEYIATELHRAPSTISRELRRNATIEGGYDNRYAQRPAMQRRHVATALPRIDAQTWVTVEARLREDWSPEQIAGTDEVAISTERIYQHIAADRQRGGTLWQHLRRRKHAGATAAARPVNASALAGGVSMNALPSSNNAVAWAIGRATPSWASDWNGGAMAERGRPLAWSRRSARPSSRRSLKAWIG